MIRTVARVAAALTLAASACLAACGRSESPPPAAATTSPPAATAQHVVLLTIDTLRADAVGAYGAPDARTPTLDALAAGGVRVDRAWATAPITLPSHASLLSGRYPPGHGARHNGVAIRADVPTLATAFAAAGFATGAFVSAFPLERRFGLDHGFDTYDSALPRGPDGAPRNERPGSDTVDHALAWLAAHPAGRVFLWVHLFEPHAPYGLPGTPGTPRERYAAEVATADRDAGRLLAGLGARAASTLVVAAADHGEAFGEHDEIGHSVFVYDSTLRVPLLFRGPGVPAGRVVAGDVPLVDVAPTVAALAGVPFPEVDGRSLRPAFDGRPLEARALYAESFAPRLDFGWAALRAVREGGWKYIAAPRPELYDVAQDPGETANRVAEEARRAGPLAAVADAHSGPELATATAVPPEATARLRSLGYLSGEARAGAGRRPDPKDRVGVAARLATATSGEVQGEALIATLEAVLREDPDNPQAHLRLGFAELARDRCGRAEPHLRSALTAGVPSADAGLGLARCRAAAGDRAGATRALEAAQKAEPGNPVVSANLGLLALEDDRLPAAITALRTAARLDPTLYEARFALARALARAGDRGGAAAEASALLRDLPPGMPQRAEVERLVAALRP